MKDFRDNTTTGYDGEVFCSVELEAMRKQNRNAEDDYREHAIQSYKDMFTRFVSLISPPKRYSILVRVLRYIFNN